MLGCTFLHPTLQCTFLVCLSRLYLPLNTQHALGSVLSWHSSVSSTSHILAPDEYQLLHLWKHQHCIFPARESESWKFMNAAGNLSFFCCFLLQLDFTNQVKKFTELGIHKAGWIWLVTMYVGTSNRHFTRMVGKCFQR